MTKPTAVITFDPILDLRRVTLNGRYIFGERFRRALLEHGTIDHLYVLGDVEDNRITAYGTGLGPHIDGKLRFAPLHALPRILAEHTVLAVHTAINQELLGPLTQVGHFTTGPRPPLTATIHASYGAFIPHLVAMSHAATGSRDALICPSASARRGIQRLLSHVRGDGAHANTPPRFELATIPHGIDTELFRPRDRDAARDALGLPRDRTILLYVGRLAPFSKLDFDPILRTLAPLWRRPDPPLLAILGTQEEAYAAHLRTRAAALGIDLQLDFGREGEALALTYCAADVFLGLSDNVTEMFGLTIQEAMASGVAVVAAEVGGYRDLVLHEENGLLVDTYIGDGAGSASHLIPFREEAELIARFNASVGLDLPGVLHAVTRLLDAPELRARLAKVAREHVEETMTWPKVVEEHIALWRRLNAKVTPSPRQAADLGFPAFAAYKDRFTHTICDDTPLTRTEAGANYSSERDTLVPAQLDLVDEALVEWILSHRESFTCAALLKRPDQPPTDDPDALRCAVYWAMRQGFLAPKLREDTP